MRGKYFAIIIGLLLVHVSPFVTDGAERKGGAANLLFIIDSSRSMSEMTPDGRRRLDMVKESVTYLAEGLSGDINMGMMAFGHRDREKYGANDIEMVIPIGPLDGMVVRWALDSLRPNGLSPLAASLRKGAEWLMNVKGRSCIILLTDGKENCGGDPIGTARWIKENLSVGVVIDVVGLNVPGPARQQLEGIANAGAGRYYAVENSADMTSTLVNAVSKRTGAYHLPKKKRVSMGGGKGRGNTRVIKTEEKAGGVSREDGLGRVILHYANMAPQSIRIYDQETDEQKIGSGMWINLRNTFKTSLEPGVYRLDIDMRGRRETLSVRNIVIKADRETSINLD